MIKLLLKIACRPSLQLASECASLSCTSFPIAVLALRKEAINAARAKVLLAVLRLQLLIYILELNPTGTLLRLLRSASAIPNPVHDSRPCGTFYQLQRPLQLNNYVSGYGTHGKQQSTST